MSITPNSNRQFAIAPTANVDYLTANKKYPIQSSFEKESFVIIDDDGVEIFCKTSKCGHLNGNDWTII